MYLPREPVRQNRIQEREGLEAVLVWFRAVPGPGRREFGKRVLHKLTKPVIIISIGLLKAAANGGREKTISQIFN
jgi:hypothetical protein